MGNRRRAREAALMMLYQIDVSRFETELAIERFLASFDGGEMLLDPPPSYLGPGEAPTALSADAREYAGLLERGVQHDLEAIDARIQAVSSHWRLDRMARVDRNILRLGTFELVHRADDVPRKVAINEAIELAKTFGTAESSAFVNGILDRVRP